MLISLKTLIDEMKEGKELRTLLSSFSCSQDEDIEHFFTIDVGGFPYANFEHYKEFCYIWQVEMFADAVEASANDRPDRIHVAARQLKGKDDLIYLKRLREKANESK